MACDVLPYTQSLQPQLASFDSHFSRLLFLLAVMFSYDCLTTSTVFDRTRRSFLPLFLLPFLSREVLFVFVFAVMTKPVETGFKLRAFIRFFFLLFRVKLPLGRLQVKPNEEVPNEDIVERHVEFSTCRCVESPSCISSSDLSHCRPAKGFSEAITAIFVPNTSTNSAWNCG